jgi:hypothetical protein
MTAKDDNGSFGVTVSIETAPAPPPGAAAAAATYAGSAVIPSSPLQEASQLQQQCSSASAAAPVPAAAPAAADSPVTPSSPLQEARQLLEEQLLQQLASFAEPVCAAHCVRYCCNHSGCTNLSGLSELELVGKPNSRCSGCKASFYCSRECQVAAWPLHKRVCKRLQAAHVPGQGDV